MIVLASLLITAAVGCGGGPTAPAALRIAANGYLERGAIIALTALRNGTAVPAGSVVWSAVPASAMSILPTGVAQLTDTGVVTVTAHADSLTATLTVHIATPPTIVFDMQDSGAGNRDVYRMALDGRDLQRLSSGAGDNVEPTVAGHAVVFTSYRDGYAALYTVPTTGGSESRLAAVPAPASQAALSSDGSRLAFISPVAGNQHLWTAAGDGSNPTQATGGPGFSSALQASPSWAPAGDTLVAVTTQYGNAAIARLAVATAAETPLTSGSTTDVNPAWSPDNQSIVFASTRDGDLALFALTLPGGSVRRLSAPAASHAEPSWLSDGRIVYTAGSGSSTQLRWMDPAHPDTGRLIPTIHGNDPRRATRL